VGHHAAKLLRTQPRDSPQQCEHRVFLSVESEKISVHHNVTEGSAEPTRIISEGLP
jgi:hypothetical protein